MKLSDIIVCAVRLYAAFSFIEVLKQFLDTVIFVGMLPISQLAFPLAVNVAEFVLLSLLFAYAPAIAKRFAADKEMKNLPDRLFRLYIVKLALFISSVIIVFCSLTNAFSRLSSAWSNITEVSRTTPSFHTVMSLEAPWLAGYLIFAFLGLVFFILAVKIGDKA